MDNYVFEVEVEVMATVAIYIEVDANDEIEAKALVKAWMDDGGDDAVADLGSERISHNHEASVSEPELIGGHMATDFTVDSDELESFEDITNHHGALRDDAKRLAKMDDGYVEHHIKSLEERGNVVEANKWKAANRLAQKIRQGEVAS